MSNVLLCIDDSLTIQTIAEITFRHSDWTYVGARSASEARTAAKSKAPAIILVDAVMPDGSGYDLAKELKAAHSEATVVMLCGNSEGYDSNKGDSAGCSGTVTKPWQTDKILVQLAEIASTSAAKPAAPKAPAAVPVSVKPDASGPRSATLMGIPALQMPKPSKPLPAGVAAIKPSIPAVKPMAVAPLRTPSPAIPAASNAVRTPPPEALTARLSPIGAREPMIKKAPGKPIRLVLAGSAEAAARDKVHSAGLSGDQASALSSLSREVLEQIIWEVVPDLAEAIIRENLETLTAKSR